MFNTVFVSKQYFIMRYLIDSVSIAAMDSTINLWHNSHGTTGQHWHGASKCYTIWYGTHTVIQCVYNIPLVVMEWQIRVSNCDKECITLVISCLEFEN